MKDLIRIEEELEELKQADVENEKCLVIDAANVYLLDSKMRLSLTDYFTLLKNGLNLRLDPCGLCVLQRLARLPLLKKYTCIV